jgi:hypothetical protein
MIKKILNHRRVISFSIHECNNCGLALSDGYALSIGCLVRFEGKENNFICTNDHGHKFGLTAPYDAEVKIKEAIENKEIKDIEFNMNTGDLNLYFDSGILQLISNSGGYENYQIDGPNDLLIVIHGGKQK